MGGETRYSEMDFFELTKIIISRVQKLEPENAVKIMGCIFLKEPGEQDMIQLAFGPDNALLSKISDAKAMLGILSPKTAASVPDLPHQFSHPFSSPATFHVPGPYWEPLLASGQHTPIHNLDFVPRLYPDSIGDQSQFLGLEEQIDPANAVGGGYYYQDVAMGGELPSRASRRTSSLPEFPIKACHYFYRGFCKHGENCRYFHGHSIPNDYSQLFGPSMSEVASEDNGFVPGSLEKLEREIADLLRSRRGVPISIASLPMMYYERYGRTLQAEGYLTESQRHGKAGFSLTKLLARLKNTIRLIDRPHGQHSVILAEDASRYMDCRSERSDSGAIVASSHQIYLTFPAESTFTEEDVSNYFKQYGPVRDVRIPCQEKRMFGFVSFLYPETVKIILIKRNPHYICGARVLVKPYREKSRMADRPYMEKEKPSIYHSSHYLEMDPELHSMPRGSDSSRLIRKHLIEEQEKLFELERRRLSEFNLVAEPLVQQPYFSPNEFPLTDHFSYTLDAMNNGSTSDDKARNSSNNFSDMESGLIDLPESPFASPPIGSSISTVI